ncbi:hypothetical protein CD33_00365 [Ureibacillus sinduriensis BLB-1 = JCM 15800]|uniref:Uncharacterized protein n=1 Tax=Ureibacillus sinduriensis BLB-1 = JCM 15800 TaxID=1384057 RepID=A0A0A3I4L4_9BACL|nr:hypothetical protein CD33_00365 [Ureibacillus sinduriensis BLB-1 = JCM 15800]
MLLQRAGHQKPPSTPINSYRFFHHTKILYFSQSPLFAYRLHPSQPINLTQDALRAHIKLEAFTYFQFQLQLLYIMEFRKATLPKGD